MTIKTNSNVLEHLRQAVFTGLVEVCKTVLAPALKERLLAETSPPPSTPGTWPHHQLQETSPGHEHLSDSIMVVPQEDGRTVSVGSSEIKALYLEFGTDRMEPRPVWLQTVIDMRDAMQVALQQAAAAAVLGTLEMTTDVGINVNPGSIEGAAIPSTIPGGTNG